MDLDIQSIVVGIVLLLCSSGVVSQRQMFMGIPGMAQGVSASTLASCCIGVALIVTGMGYSGWDLVPEPLRSILEPILSPVISVVTWPLKQVF